MRRLYGAVLAGAALLLSGCAVGPDYKRPAVAVPGTFRGAASPAADASVGDRKWAEVFGDAALNRLVGAALDRNFDLRMAAERVEQARAQYGIARAEQFPYVDAQAGLTASRSSSLGAFKFIQKGTDLSASYTEAGLALSWELDLWGRIRRLSEAARAEYLATEEARRGLTVTLVSEVSGTYFQLMELELELAISRKTRDIAEDSLRPVRLRRERGAASGLDVSQADQLLYTAAARIEAVRRGIGQTENALSLLLGGPPSDQPRGAAIDQTAVPPELPAGLPSALLERRPDIRQAEQQLIAANARIGAAKALYFPRIALTAFAGAQSRALTELATAPARVYTATPSGLMPIFHAGEIRGQVRLSEARQRELVIAYERAIDSALREVSDALIAFARTRDERARQQSLVAALQESVRLSTLRYKGGLDSYLQVLDAQRNLFRGELGLARLRLDERLSVVQVYRALGGGWQ